MEETNPSLDERLKKQSRASQPTSRKSRSISRYFLGNKRSSMDITSQDIDISRCLTSIGIFDACLLWTHVTLFHDYTTCRRLFIITDKKQLFIGKSQQKQSLFKVKHQIDLNRVWIYNNVNENTALEITSLTYYDRQRTLLIGWPVAENFLVEFDTKDICNVWFDHIQRILNFNWQNQEIPSEHVRIVIDPNHESDQNNNHRTAFVIRKVIGIRPQDTVRDLIKKCIDTSYLRDSVVENYVLYVINLSHQPINSSSSTQLNSSSLIPLIAREKRMHYERLRRVDRYYPNFLSFLRTSVLRSQSVETIYDHRQRKGHEYPYAIKMKHFKTSNPSSFETDDHLSVQSSSTLYSHHSSTTSLNHVTSKSHDFELRKRESDQQTKKHRFFPKRKVKENSAKLLSQTPSQDDQYSSSALIRTKSSSNFFGQTLDELITKSNPQLPAVIQQLLEILYFKGPETTGIFRKVANTRAVKESIEKIERNIPLPEDELHPILAAGIFKHFLRTLPEPVFSTIQYDNWKKCFRLPVIQERIIFARRNIIGTLSESNHLVLKGFICTLHRISQDAESNGMNPFNLGLCVSHSLFKTESTTITSGKQEADVMSSIVEFLIVNASSLFGADVLTCIPDKHIIVHQQANLGRPAASSTESLDEVESSPHVPVVNRSRDSGLATSDQPCNDDSSEVSEHFRRQTSPPPPDWIPSIAYGMGTVLTSIILPPSISRGRIVKNPYKPSKHFLEREKLTTDTTDDSDHGELHGDSSVRSSTTTVHNMTITKIKRSKPISRHSSLGSNEHYLHPQQNVIKEFKRSVTTDVKRASSMKQVHHGSDEGDQDEDEHNRTLNANTSNMTITAATTKKNTIKNEAIPLPPTNERRMKLVKSKTRYGEEETMMTRSVQLEPQDLDLTSEPLSTINQRLSNSSAIRSASFTTNAKMKKLDPPFLVSTCLPHEHHSRSQQPVPSATIPDGRSRHNGPLAATTNQIYNNSRSDHHHHSQTNSNSTERDRTFVHHSDSRPFKLGTAIQMKPLDDLLLSSSSANGRRRPCHRQNALRYKSIDQNEQEPRTAPIIINQNRIYSSHENPSSNISRHQSIERRAPPTSNATTATATAPIKSFSFDINHELLPSDVSWSVREKAKLFEHTQPKKFSTGRENYV